MPVWLESAVVLIAIISVCYARSLYTELKLTKELLELSRSANKQMTEKLEIANQQIADIKAGSSDKKTKSTKMPAFLSADDPMDALLRDVGRISR